MFDGGARRGSGSAPLPRGNRAWQAGRHMVLRRAMDGESIDGLQRVILNERARLLRFLAARGAGDEAEDVLHDLWQRVVDRARPAGGRSGRLSVPRRRESDARPPPLDGQPRAPPDGLARGRSYPEDEPLGERVLIARERMRQAEAMLAGLGPRVDRVFRLYRLDGMGQAAIARDLGISLSSVEKDLQKAYRALSGLKARFDAE